MDDKKSTYNAKAQKKYNANFKNIACKVSIEKYNIIKEHAINKGFISINSYVIDLINKDINI